MVALPVDTKRRIAAALKVGRTKVFTAGAFDVSENTVRRVEKAQVEPLYDATYDAAVERQTKRDRAHEEALAYQKTRWE